MARKIVLALLLGLVIVTMPACFSGIDAARQAGERARGEDRAATGDRESDVTDAQEQEQSTYSADRSEESTAADLAEEQATTEITTGEPVLDAKWYQDSDGNFVPDFIEVANGFDPNRDDCAPEKCPGAAESIDFYTSPRNALLILDSSGSMAAGDGTGQSKMEAAKESILRYSEVSSVVYNTGFAVFGNTGDATKAGKVRSCSDAAEVLLPLGEVDQDNFQGVVDQFEPTGWTPIEGALREAGKTFSGHEDETNRVILVSDGLETCGGDPVAAAEELRRSGVALTIDVVGFGVSGDESEQLRDIAAAGGGEYVDAATGADLDEYFQEQSDAMHKTFDAFTCELGNGTNDTICDQNQCNDATAFRIPEEQQKYEYGSPEYNALQDISNHISEGLEERQVARDEASDRASRLQEQWSKMQEEYYRAFNEAYGVG